MRQFLLALALAVAICSSHGEEEETPKKHNEPIFTTYEFAGTLERQVLYRELLASYEPSVYPSNTTVELGLVVLDVQLDEEKNRMNTDAWLRYQWTDDRLTWDKEALGISVMRVPPSKIWTPDVTVYNSADQVDRAKCWQSNVIIFNTGKILWVPPCHLETYCNLTLSREPYKEQLCAIKFGSWTFDGLTIGLDFYKRQEKQADVSINYQGAIGKYEITSNTAVRTEKKYDCCKEPYLDITYTLGFTRRGAKKCEV